MRIKRHDTVIRMSSSWPERMMRRSYCQRMHHRRQGENPSHEQTSSVAISSITTEHIISRQGESVKDGGEKMWAQTTRSDTYKASELVGRKDGGIAKVPCVSSSGRCRGRWLLVRSTRRAVIAARKTRGTLDEFKLYVNGLVVFMLYCSS